MFDALNERRLAAIILGDVVGYSRLMGIDEVGTMTALKAHRNELILPAIAAYRGRMVGSPGDAMLMEFGSAVEAVSCAVAMQRKMIARNVEVSDERRIRFRLGINLGDIVIDGEEIYGDGVNVAARLESLCEPGGLCLSRSIEEQVRQKLTLPFTDGGEQQLKNISHPMRIFRLSAEFIATLPETALPAARRKSTTIQAKVAPGSILNNTYKIDELIGAGGMGEIFKGHEIHSGGLVAVKVIRPDMMENETALALFQREALVLKDIHHDAIVRYYIFSFDPDSKRHYLTMEFVDGIALSNLVKRGPLPFEAVTALCRRVASGLQVAHERGIVHRDVSPDNIIAPSGDVSRAKIIDFGIARATDIGAGTIIGGGFAGKYNYVSPEQLGLAGSEVTAQSDIYSFGLVLAEASLGQPLDMGGTQAEVIDKRRIVPDLKGLDHRLRPLIERMLQPDPANRPASMEEVAAWSSNAMTAIATPAKPERQPRPIVAPSTTQKAAKPARHIERWIIGGTLCMVLAGGAGLLAYQTWFAAPVSRPPLNNPAPLNTTPLNDKPTPSETPPAGDTPSIGGSLPDMPVPNPQAGPPATGPQAGPPLAPQVPPNTPPTSTSTDEPTAPEEPSPNSPTPTPGGGSQLQPTVTPVSVGRITDYIKGYQAGGCLFAQPGRITPSSAAIDGFAQSRADIEGLDQGFTHTIGFQPDITAVRIVARQCPALDFMRHVKTDDTAPALILTSDRVSHDQALAGEVQVKAEHSIALLQVRDDGTVINMSKALKADGSAQTFELHALHASSTGVSPQLLIAVASPHPLDTLTKAGDRKADEVFRAILDEAGKKGDTVSANVKAFLAGG